MKLFVVFGVLAVIMQSFSCAPLQSSGSSIITINGGPTIKTTYTNGKAEYFIDGKPTTEQQVKDILAKANTENGITSMGSVNIGGEMSPKEQKAFDQKMGNFEKNMAKQMEHMREQMAQTMGNFEKPGWPFNQ